MSDSYREERERLADEAVEKPELVKRFVEDLAGPSRRNRQNAGALLAAVAYRDPAVLKDHISAIIDALNRPEAQTRWECLDILSKMVAVDSRACEKAVPGAETCLFDDYPGALRLASFRFLCVYGATTPARSLKVWPLIDEAYQCYHGDVEFLDMLSMVADFSAGKLDAQVANALRQRLAFDAENGRGSIKKRTQQILEGMN